MTKLASKLRIAIMAKRENLSSLFKRPYSMLYIIKEDSGWVLDVETQELLKIATELDVKAKVALGLAPKAKQCLHYTSRSMILEPKIFETNHRISFDYFHGLPENDKIFADCYHTLCKRHERISRIRVSQSQIEQLVLSSGMDRNKVHRIPIGINLDYFRLQTLESKMAARKKLGLPENAIVIGSFQKDGNGWNEGLEPKLIKGPDIFLKTIEILKHQIPELWVLLTGPARGYVKQGLERLGVPYKHRFLQDYSKIGNYYEAIDLYIVASREEGGPKAVLESMASGIPLVTTRVGQAMDLVTTGENACMVENEDYEGLAYWAQVVLQDSALRKRVIEKGYGTAKANTYPQQLGMWQAFFKGYVGV